MQFIAIHYAIVAYNFLAQYGALVHYTSVLSTEVANSCTTPLTYIVSYC